MKYFKLVLPITILILLFCYAYKDKSGNMYVFDIEKIRSIEKEATNRKDSVGEAASLSYIDSLSQLTKYEPLNVYSCFLNTLKIKFDSKILTEQKIAAYLNQIKSPLFAKQNEYNKYKITRELAIQLHEYKNYQAAIEQDITALKYIEPKSDKYSIEIAKLYHHLGLLFLKTPEHFTEVKNVFSLSQKLYAESGDFENSSLMLYNLSDITLRLKQHDLSIQYTYQAIEEYKKFSANANFSWSFYYPNLFINYQKCNKLDSANYIYALALTVHQTKQITDDSYANFISETLEYMVKRKNYAEVEKNIAYIVSISKNKPYIAEIMQSRCCLIYKAKAAVARDRNDKNVERKELQHLLHYSFDGANDYYFSSFYIEALNRLIELDSTSKNTQELSLWYTKKLELSSLNKEENENYLKHSDFWSALNIKPIEQELGIQNKKLLEENIRLIIVSVFSILILSVLRIIFNLYKKIRNREYELKQKQENLKNANHILNKHNTKLQDLYKDITNKNNIILSQNEQMKILVDKLNESNENLRHFAQSAAHDLKAPLRTISSFSKVLQKRYQSKIEEEDSIFFKFIIDSCYNLDHVINRLLHSSINNNKNP